MKREWKPGDVAMLSHHGGTPAVRAPKECGNEEHDYAEGDHWHYLTPLGACYWDSNGETDARPLVVIDPEDREAVERLLVTYGQQFTDWTPETDTNVTRLQAALREFANPKPPKPEEPQGLGAVVEDDEGGHWVAIGRFKRPDATRWRQEYGAASGLKEKYSDIDAVRVLSEGVQP